MKIVFADALYWIAIVHPNDPWKLPANEARQAIDNAILVTTDEVLTEFLAALSKSGQQLRKQAVEMVRAIMKNPNVRVVPQTREGFLKGLDRFESRLDKHYSLTDCISMNVIVAERIQEVLTNDRHFEQEGFTVLIRKGEA